MNYLPKINQHIFFLFIILQLAIIHVFGDIEISTNDLKIKLYKKGHCDLNVDRNTTAQEILFGVQHNDIVRITPNIVRIENVNVSYKIHLEIEAIGAGHSEISAINSTNPAFNIKKLYVRTTVYKVDSLDTISTIIGWVYFVAWSVSFYPQMYINFRRKSVVGLNFDFLILNLIGFSLYGLFNVGLYYVDEFKTEYSNRYPKGLNPVQINDVVFAIHAAIATLITIAQCFIYERSNQKVSITARVILGVFGIVLITSIILSWATVIQWLDFLYVCSYIKLTITLIKYIPQAYMNYTRKSTVGWSIENILLDFTGGTLSMLQMIISSYNYDDWVSIFGDPTKFGLGLFSVIFDIFFIIQHYILYKNSVYEIR